jgi:hypothetical protein
MSPSPWGAEFSSRFTGHCREVVRFRLRSTSSNARHEGFRPPPDVQVVPQEVDADCPPIPTFLRWSPIPQPREFPFCRLK